MAKYPNMRKSAKAYESDIGSFNWSDAETVAGMTLNSAGVKQAKALIAQALAAKLKKPVGKTGIVKGDLVFRIKYNGKSHFGDGDIVLLKGFETLAEDVKLSSKSKNAGHLSVSSQRDPLTVQWWSETLGAIKDPSRMTALIREYQSNLTALSRAESAGLINDTVALFADFKSEAQKLAKGAFSNTNDLRILKKLIGGIAIHEKEMRARSDSYQANLGQQAREFMKEVELTEAQLKKQFGGLLAEVQKPMDRRNWEDAEKAFLKVQQLFLQRERMLSADMLEGMLKTRLRNAKLNPDDFPISRLPAVTRSAAATLAELNGQMQAVWTEIQTELAAVPATKMDRTLAELPKKIKALTEVCKRILDGATKAEDMLGEPSNSVNDRKTGWQWLEFAQTETDRTLLPNLNRFDGILAEQRRSADRSDAKLMKFLDSAEKSVAALRSKNLRDIEDMIARAVSNRRAAPAKIEEWLDKAERAVEKNFTSKLDQLEAGVVDAEAGQGDAAKLERFVEIAQNGLSIVEFLDLKPYRVWLYLEGITKHADFAAQRQRLQRVKQDFQAQKDRFADLRRRAEALTV